MTIPAPKQGLVIRYSYVWHRESMAGREEGQKDRPCAVVLTSKNGRVAVAPITHTQPTPDTLSLELPAHISRQAGLDDARSWIVTGEVNVFRWPGEDIRPATRDSWAFGNLPPKFAKGVVEDVLEQQKRLKYVNRDQPLPPKDWKKKPELSGEIKKAPPPKKDRDRSR